MKRIGVVVGIVLAGVLLPGCSDNSDAGKEIVFPAASLLGQPQSVAAEKMSQYTHIGGEKPGQVTYTSTGGMMTNDREYEEVKTPSYQTVTAYYSGGQVDTLNVDGLEHLVSGMDGWEHVLHCIGVDGEGTPTVINSEIYQWDNWNGYRIRAFAKDVTPGNPESLGIVRFDKIGGRGISQ